jgi:hypothetical protein
LTPGLVLRLQTATGSNLDDPDGPTQRPNALKDILTAIWAVPSLMRGKLDGFSLDRLFRFLNAFGRDVEIVIRPAKHSGDADTKVVSD